MSSPACPIRKNFREVSLYLVVGVFGLAIDSGIFFTLLYSGTSPMLAQWIGAGVGAVHNSIWHHYAVFDHDKKLRHTVAPNIAISLTTVGASGPLLQLLDSATGDIVFSKVVVLGATTFGTYFLRKFIVFGKEGA
jgi:putative flippase GtrA